MDLPDSDQHYLYKKNLGSQDLDPDPDQGEKLDTNPEQHLRKKKNHDPNPDPHQGDKSNPDPHQSEVDLQHWAKQSRVRIQL